MRYRRGGDQLDDCKGHYKSGISGRPGNSTDFVKTVRKYQKSAEIPQKKGFFDRRARPPVSE